MFNVLPIDQKTSIFPFGKIKKNQFISINFIYILYKGLQI